MKHTLLYTLLLAMLFHCCTGKRYGFRKTVKASAVTSPQVSVKKVHVENYVASSDSLISPLTTTFLEIEDSSHNTITNTVVKQKKTPRSHQQTHREATHKNYPGLYRTGKVIMGTGVFLLLSTLAIFLYALLLIGPRLNVFEFLAFQPISIIVSLGLLLVMIGICLIELSNYNPPKKTRKQRLYRLAAILAYISLALVIITLTVANIISNLSNIITIITGYPPFLLVISIAIGLAILALLIYILARNTYI